MLTPVTVTFVFIFAFTYGRVLLYNTENDQTVEKFDCVYYKHNDGEEISYCRPELEPVRPDRNRTGSDYQPAGKKPEIHRLKILKNVLF
jgi:hypothetical protein